jgi:D-3-phosphoglycerate dehydrogenase
MIKVTALTGDAESEVAGALFGRREGRIVRINGFNLEALPKGHMILLFNRDEPGVLGRVASFIGEQHVNISRLYLGRKKIGENAVALIQLDQKMSEEGVRGLEKLTGVISVKQVEL